MTRPDIALVFVPQWSPFQPPLSLPSLAAWLRRAGFEVSCWDANLAFYDWLLARERIPALRNLIEENVLLEQKTKNAYYAILNSYDDFEGDFRKLKSKTNNIDGQELLRRGYTGFKAFDSYLSVITDIVPGVEISPFEFSVLGGTMQTASLEHFADSPPIFIESFAKEFVAQLLSVENAKIYGLSCIGQEQLPFTLLIGRLIKETTNTPVVVGGTILSRIFEKGVLKREWFTRYFDVVVRNEGEKPAEGMIRNLRADRPICEDVPGVVFVDNNRIQNTPPATPLRPEEVPPPDFDQMPIDGYYCLEVTLPLLASRGCYWGKCEFCHHGMVFGDKYSPHDAKSVLNTVLMLNEKYGVKQFAFNDEALPPNILARMIRLFPDSAESGFTFTGLIKFEKYFTTEHFIGLRRIGFRSLYVGLESASDRVLKLMRKHCEREVIIQNLTSAKQAGLWFHCFLFFGFPGETEEDANLTYRFMIDNHDIVGSFGCGTFSLEHNAPIMRHPKEFGLTPLESVSRDLDVYYNYTVDTGLTAEHALEWSEKLSVSARDIPKYFATNWIPREMLLSLLTRLNADELVALCVEINRNLGIPPMSRLSDVVSLSRSNGNGEDLIIVNRLNRRVVRLFGNLMTDVEVTITQKDESIKNIESLSPFLSNFLALL